MYKICSKLIIKTPERRQSRHSGVLIVNFEHISQIVCFHCWLCTSSRQKWYSGYHYCTTSFNKPELRFCAGSRPARGVSEIRNGENLWQWSRLEIRLNAFRRSTIPQKQFIIIIIRSLSYRNHWFTLQINELVSIRKDLRHERVNYTFDSMTSFRKIRK